VEEEKDGRRRATDQPKEYELEYLGRAEPTVSVRRPWAYLVPASQAKAIEALQRHGLEVDELREDIELPVEVYRTEPIKRGGGTFQKHQLNSVQATARSETRRVEAGTKLVKTGQALGSLAVYLLEPQSEDGLATWNFFDDALKEGQDYPVLRLPSEAAITSGK